MTEERKHAILFAATILLARKLMPTLENETPDLTIEHYQWRAIHQASRILEKIDEKWPLPLLSETQRCQWDSFRRWWGDTVSIPIEERGVQSAEVR